jgi:hypothetical protein
MEYIEIEQLVYGEPVDPRIIEDLLHLELVDTRRLNADRILIAEADCEEFRAMLRLMVELEINANGVATIMHMRRRMRELRAELRQLRQLSK